MPYTPECQPSIESCNALLRDLESIVAETREFIERAHVRRKYDLHNPGDWLSLQEDLHTDRFANSLDAQSIARLQSCCVRWLHRYRRLRFIAATRPVWNT